METLISVIVPVYNVEPYLRKCVDSILNQTYRNLEVILVDDGSPDGCPALCDEYAAKDDRVRVIHKQNGGLSDARNAGLRAMTGEYATFVDSDDWIEPDHIQSLYRLLAGKQNHVISVSDIRRVDESGHLLEVMCQQGMEHIALEPIFGFVWNKLYSVELIRGAFFDDVRYVEDYPFNLQLLCKDAEYVYSGTCTYNYMRREKSILTSEVTVEKVGHFLDFNEKVWPHLCKAFPDTYFREKIYTEISAIHMCNFLCDISVSEKFSFVEKTRLCSRIINSVFQRTVRWKYAPHNLLRLAIVAKRLHSPWVYVIVYQLINLISRRTSN